MNRKKTKIVATISDRRCEPEFIKKLADAGMNVARLNTAHQSIEDTLKIVKNIRSVSDHIAILIDTKGPEIRTTTSDEKIIVKTGDTIRISGGPDKKTTRECLYVSHPGFNNEIKVGDKVLIDDGNTEIEIISKDTEFLYGKVLNDGEIGSRKSVNIPGASFSLPALSDKDKEYVQFAIDQDIDFIAHSFVRNKNDVLAIQEILEKSQTRVKIIAKIENQEGVENLEEILDHVYGVMVARGDLAIEIPYEQIPGIQKNIVNRCIEKRKPVIIATQMLHSMIDHPRPTRAEVSDIANAIYSKTDAIMLSGETAYGNYPVESVETMAKVASEVEKSRSDINDIPYIVLSTETSAYLTRSAVEASLKLHASAIVADTVSGRTIRNLASYRGKKPVFAMCSDKRTIRELALSFGVFPYFMEREKSTPEFIRNSITFLCAENQAQLKDRLVVLAGNFGRHHGASFIEISTVDNLLNYT